MRKILGILLIVVFCISGNVFAEMLSIKGDKVNMRSGPGADYRIEWKYGKGFPLKVISRKGKWCKVQDFENDTGWIFASLLSKKPHMVVKANKNKDQKINLRSGPGTEYKVVGKAYYGIVFETLDQLIHVENTGKKKIGFTIKEKMASYGKRNKN